MKKSKFPKEISGDYTESWSDENIEEYKKELDIEIKKDSDKIKHCFGISFILVALISMTFNFFGNCVIGFTVGSVLFVILMIVIYKLFQYKENITWNKLIKTFPNDMFKIKK